MLIEYYFFTFSDFSPTPSQILKMAGAKMNKNEGRINEIIFIDGKVTFGLFVRKTIQRLVARNLNFFFARHGNLKQRRIFDSSAFDNLYLERNTLGVTLAMWHFCAHVACRCVPIQKRLAIIVDELATSWKLNGVFVTRPNIDQVPPVKRLPIP